jgi:hypothetical protein
MPNFTTDSTVGMFNLHELIDGSFAVFARRNIDEGLN